MDINMSRPPTLETEQLILRPFTIDDAPTVQKLAGDKAIAETTLTIPYPYEDGISEEWIGKHEKLFENGKAVNFAITARTGNQLVGAISLNIEKHFDSAEMGYWIGKPYWNKGYCTEAARVLLDYGFNELGLNRIFAFHMNHNKASGQIMRKIGMTLEGCHRQAVKKWDNYIDLNMYAILKYEYTAKSANT